METETTYTVTREATVRYTLHGGSDTTAREEAADEVAGRLEALTGRGDLTDGQVAGSQIHEHPAAPFEPYTVSVSITVAVTVDAPDAERAERAGARTIADALAASELDSVSYTSPPRFSETA
ncbi:hypothetical protein [Natronobiforma cellulositropha]|uniref:hypothetical protein n=1 Tax=Natronobiforma cellulositropha TaxID=1679076 RepID=UPI0021D56B7D|nr:hypothetical protein [Natronobiforma cellulositropha]